MELGPPEHDAAVDCEMFLSEYEDDGIRKRHVMPQNAIPFFSGSNSGSGSDLLLRDVQQERYVFRLVLTLAHATQRILPGGGGLRRFLYTFPANIQAVY